MFIESQPPRPSAISKAEQQHEKKKLYNKRRFHILKSKHEVDKQELKDEVAALTSQLDVLKKTSILSWKDIAIALNEAHKISELQHRDLRKKVLMHDATNLVMKAWVLKCTQQEIYAFPTAPVQSMWQMTSLPADGPARKMGLEWMSQRLYHNLGRDIERSGVPATHDPWYSIEVERMDDSYRLIEFKQRIEHAPLDHVAKCLDKMYLTIVDGDEVEFHDANMMYVIYDSHFGQALGIPTKEKMLVSRFRDNDQYVIFTHGVVGDEKYSDAVQCSFWSAWVVIQRLSDTETLVKHSYESHGMRYSDRFLSLDEELPQLKTYFSHDAKFEGMKAYLKKNRQERYCVDLGEYAAIDGLLTRNAS